MSVEIKATVTTKQSLFPSVNDWAVAAKLNIIKSATRAAAPGLDLPRAKALDVNETSFQDYFRGLTSDAAVTVRARLADLEAKRRALYGIAFPDLSGAGEMARHELTVHCGSSGDQLEEAYRITHQAEFDMRVFRRDNDRIAEPQPSESLYRIALAGAAVIGLEALANANAFGIVRGGLIRGALVALLLAGANLAAGLGWGFAIRELLHRKLWRKTLGGAALCGYLAFLMTWSLLVAEYRTALTIDPEGAGERAVEALTLPISDLISSALHSLESVLLWGVTASCNIAAMLSVFVCGREPYPGYARVASQVTRAKGRLQAARDHYRSGIESVVGPVLKAVRDEHDRAIEARSDLHHNIAETERCIADYEGFCDKVAAAAARSISEYRRAIGAVRMVEVPPYAGVIPDLGKLVSTTPVRLALDVLKTELETAAQKQLLTKDLAAAERAIRLAMDEAQAGANTFFTECEARAHPLSATILPSSSPASPSSSIRELAA
jgi:hypothetical protein